MDERVEINRIPEISDERLKELADKIRIVVHREKEDYYGFYAIDTPKNLRSTTFSWGIEGFKKAHTGHSFYTIVTYHTCAYYGFFKPTVAEVISQIPKEIVDRVKAFRTEITDGKYNILDGDYHFAKTFLYDHFSLAE